MSGEGLGLKMPSVVEETEQLELTHVIGGESALTAIPANISRSHDSEIPLRYKSDFVQVHIQRCTGTLIKALFVASLDGMKDIMEDCIMNNIVENKIEKYNK